MISDIDLVHSKLLQFLAFVTMEMLTWRKNYEKQTWPPATPCTMVGSQSAMWNRLLIVPDACLRSHFEETGRKQSSLNLVQIWDECRNPGSPFQQVAQAASQGRVWAPSCSRALQYVGFLLHFCCWFFQYTAPLVSELRWWMWRWWLCRQRSFALSLPPCTSSYHQQIIVNMVPLAIMSLATLNLIICPFLTSATDAIM